MGAMTMIMEWNLEQTDVSYEPAAYIGIIIIIVITIIIMVFKDRIRFKAVS